MKYVPFVLACCIIFSLVATAGNGPSIENEFVKVEIRLTQSKLKAGTKAQLLISLKPKNGIHININPPMNLTLVNDSIFTLSGKMEFSTINKDTSQFLDPSKPIKQTIMLAKRTKTGAVSLKGTFMYYYCSDAAGWCSRFKQPINIKVTVVR